MIDLLITVSWQKAENTSFLTAAIKVWYHSQVEPM